MNNEEKNEVRNLGKARRWHSRMDSGSFRHSLLPSNPEEKGV